MFNIALFEPEIPYNTGNISRLCVGTGCELTLVGKPAFSLDDTQLKRAGLDHWDDLKLTQLPSLDAFSSKPEERFILLSTYGEKLYWEHEFQQGDTLLFGCETRGLPQEFIQKHREKAYALPLPGPARSLNLSNAVSAVIFEGLRQLSVKGQEFALPRELEGRRAYFDMFGQRVSED